MTLQRISLTDSQGQPQELMRYPKQKLMCRGRGKQHHMWYVLATLPTSHLYKNKLVTFEKLNLLKQ